MYSIPSPWLHTHPLHNHLISFAAVSQHETNYSPVRIYFFHEMLTMKLRNIIHLGFSSCLNLVSCKIFMFHLWLWTVYSGHSKEHSHSRKNIRHHLLSKNLTASMCFFIFQLSILYSYAVRNVTAHSILGGWTVLQSLLQIQK